MLVHSCVECDTISINRIAADDDPESVLAVFQSSFGVSLYGLYDHLGILMLNAGDTEVVYTQLYGQNVEFAIA